MSDDVAVLDALLGAGADIEAPGAVLGGGPPMADARGFKQWGVTHRFVARGARRGDARFVRPRRGVFRWSYNALARGHNGGVLGRLSRWPPGLRAVPPRAGAPS
ncbi:MAG: hypothetical protein ACR2OB_13270 [Solirubrobacteraceae bacterium]